MLYAQEIGIPTEDEAFDNAVYANYFNTATNQIDTAPPTGFIRTFTLLQESLPGLNADSLGGLTVDAKHINSGSFYLEAARAINKFAVDHPNEPLTESIFRQLCETSIGTQLVTMGNALSHIHLSENFPAEQKQSLIHI